MLLQVADDEDVLFGELLVTQIKQLKPEVKLIFKIQICYDILTKVHTLLFSFQQNHKVLV